MLCSRTGALDNSDSTLRVEKLLTQCGKSGRFPRSVWETYSRSVEAVLLFRAKSTAPFSFFSLDYERQHA